MILAQARVLGRHDFQRLVVVRGFALLADLAQPQLDVRPGPGTQSRGVRVGARALHLLESAFVVFPRRPGGERQPAQQSIIRVQAGAGLLKAVGPVGPRVRHVLVRHDLDVLVPRRPVVTLVVVHLAGDRQRLPGHRPSADVRRQGIHLSFEAVPRQRRRGDA